jgi:hypothetical protein
VSDETVFCHSSSFTGGVCCSLPNKGRFQKPKELIEGVKKNRRLVLFACWSCEDVKMFSSSIMAAQLMANAEACNIMMQHFVALEIVR